MIEKLIEMIVDKFREDKPYVVTHSILLYAKSEKDAMVKARQQPVSSWRKEAKDVT